MMYDRSGADSGTSTSVTAYSGFRPQAVIGVGVKWNCKKVESSLHNSTSETIRGELTEVRT